MDGDPLLREDPLVGRTLHSFEILEPIGRGASAQVYRARHVFLGHRSAVKVLFRHAGRNPTLEARFLREAQVTSRILHDNVVRVLDFGRTPEGLSFLVMEWLEGPTLARRLEEAGPMSPRAAAVVVRQVAAGLAAAHAQGLVHRDLKPSNILLARGDPGGEPTAKILDFGLVRQEGPTGAALTQPGHLLGTPWYMAPEIIADEPVTVAADLYSLGAILFEGLTGRVPFDAPTLPELLSMHLAAPPPRLAPCGGLEELVAALLSKRPDARPAGAEQVVAWLDRLSLGEGRAELLDPAAPATPATPRIAWPAPLDPQTPSRDLASPFAPTKTAPALEAESAPEPPRPRRPRSGALGVLVAVGALLFAGALIIVTAALRRAPAASPAPPPAAPALSEGTEVVPRVTPRPEPELAPAVGEAPPVRSGRKRRAEPERAEERGGEQHEQLRLARGALARAAMGRGLRAQDLLRIAALDEAHRRMEAARQAGQVAEELAAVEALIAELARVSVERSLVEARLDEVRLLLLSRAAALPRPAHQALEERFLDLAGQLRATAGSEDRERILRGLAALERELSPSGGGGQ